MSSNLRSQGGLVVISGPSGVGKSTICSDVAKRLDKVYLSISVTTRAKGTLEKDGREYKFVSKEEFDKHIKQGMLLEYAEVFGSYYGTPKKKIYDALAADKIVILEIDVQGGKQIKQLYPSAVMIFILPPDRDDLAERMNHRGRGENRDNAARRLNDADTEISAAWEHYDHMVINENLEQAVEETLDIIHESFGDK